MDLSMVYFGLIWLPSGFFFGFFSLLRVYSVDEMKLVPLFVLFFQLAQGEEDSCPSERSEFDKVRDWANNIPVLKDRDEKLYKMLETMVTTIEDKLTGMTDEQAVDAFYRFISLPMQTHCTIGKWLSMGKWYPANGATDGEKYVCMDNVYNDAYLKNKCLVYSFGISYDLGFEEEMAGLGCKVHAFDPTVKPVTDNPNIAIHHYGLSHFTGKMKVKINHENNKISEPLDVKTLHDALEENGDLDKEITYLKVDVESSELSAIPEWLKTGVLKNVRQLGIELHTGKVHLTREKRPDVLKQLLKSFLEMYKLGFRLISYAPNLIVGKSQDPVDRRYYTFADVVFYKPYH